MPSRRQDLRSVKIWFLVTLFAISPTLVGKSTALPSPDQHAKAASLQADLLPEQILESSPEHSGRMISAKELVDIKRIRAFAIAPDGRKLVYQLLEPDAAANTITLNWYLVTIQDRPSTPVILTSGGMPQFHAQSNGVLNGEIAAPSVGWAPDGASFFFIKRGRTGTQIWRGFADGSAALQITHTDADVLDFELYPDGAKLIFEVGRSDAGRTEQGHHGFLIGDETVFVPFGPPGSTVVDAPALPPCGPEKWGIHGSAAMPCSPRLWIVDLRSREERSATQEEMREWSLLREVASNVRYGYVQNPPKGARASRTGGVARLREAAGELGEGPLPVRGVSARLTQTGSEYPCRDPRCSGQFMTLLGWTSNAESVIFARIEGRGVDGNSAGSEHVFYRWNLKKDIVTQITRDPALFVDALSPGAQSVRSCQVAADNIFCLHQATSSPDTIVRLSIVRLGEKTTLVDPNPWFSTVWHPRIDTLAWTDDLGAEIVDRLIFPRDYQSGHAYPLVVCGYTSDGFAWTSNSDEFPSGLFAQAGMMVLKYDIPENWRRYAKKYELVTEDENALQHQPLNSVRKAIEALRSGHVIDPSRIGIAGLSAGAEVVDDAMRSGSEFLAASAAYSAAHPFVYYMATRSGRQALDRLYGGRPSDADSRWANESVGPNASSITTALLLEVADSEFYYAYPNFADLSDAGRAVEMYVFPGEYHVKWQPIHHLSVYERNVQWFRFWLLDQEVSDPVDPEQYSRWRSLREKRAQALAYLNGSLH